MKLKPIGRDAQTPAAAAKRGCALPGAEDTPCKGEDCRHWAIVVDHTRKLPGTGYCMFRRDNK